MEKKLQNICFTDYNLLIVEDLWQAHYQILSINFHKKFIKLSVNTDTTRESVKHAELNINNPTIFLNTQKFKMI